LILTSRNDGVQSAYVKNNKLPKMIHMKLINMCTDSCRLFEDNVRALSRIVRVKPEEFYLKLNVYPREIQALHFTDKYFAYYRCNLLTKCMKSTPN